MSIKNFAEKVAVITGGWNLMEVDFADAEGPYVVSLFVKILCVVASGVSVGVHQTNVDARRRRFHVGSTRDALVETPVGSVHPKHTVERPRFRDHLAHAVRRGRRAVRERPLLEETSAPGDSAVEAQRRTIGAGLLQGALRIDLVVAALPDELDFR